MVTKKEPIHALLETKTACDSQAECVLIYRRNCLLLLLDVNSVLAQTRAELFQLKLLATSSAAKGVVIVTGLFADEVNDFFLLFAFGHYPILSC